MRRFRNLFTGALLSIIGFAGLGMENEADALIIEFDDGSAIGILILFDDGSAVL